MSARINYNRITGSNIQGDATTVTEPLGTLVVTNNGELRLHDGTTAGGNSVGGGGSGNGWQITSGSYSVSVADSGVVTMATSRGNIEFGALPEPGGPSHFHIMKSAGDNNDLYFGDDFNYVLQRGPGYNTTPGYGVEIGANDKNGGGHQVWRFGTDGTTTLASGVEISNTGTFNFLSWNTGTALIIADVPYTAGSFIYIPSSSDTNGSLGIVNTNTAGSIMLTQGSGNTTNQLYVDNSGATINNILGGISKTWTFGTDGSLAFPNNLGSANSQIYTTNGGYQTVFETFAVKGHGQKLTLDWDAAEVKIQSWPGSEWTFDQSGNLTIPGDIKSTAGTGPVVINSNDGATTHTWTFGSDGTLTAPGNLTSNNQSIGFSTTTTDHTTYTVTDNTIKFGNASNSTVTWDIITNNFSTGFTRTRLEVPLSTANTNTYVSFTSPSNTTVLQSSDLINQMPGGRQGFNVIASNTINLVTNPDSGFHGTGVGYGWTFDNAGALTFPSGAGFAYGDSGQLKINDSTTQSLDFRDASGRGFYTNGDGFSLRGNGSNTWQFGTTGTLTFPQGGTLRVSGVPAHSTGATGDKAGTVAFANGYIYYCTADYAPTQYPAETRLGDANGVDNGYLIPNSYQLPSVGWIIYYNNQTAIINQVNNGGNPGYYTVFTATPLFIPANTAIQYGPPSTDIWKRVAWSGDTW